MIIFSKSTEFPLKLQAGDVAFLCSEQHERRPYFEHVALILDDNLVASSSELGTCEVFGLPESQKAHFPERQGFHQFASNGKVWKERLIARNIDPPLGLPNCGWNFVCRFENISPRDLLHGKYLLIPQIGKIKYECGFLQTGPDNSRTANCLGFVSLYYKYAGRDLFDLPFPAYPEPYEEFGERNYPSPGHLAHVMNTSDISFPYKPSSRAEAEETSHASKILHRMLETPKV